MNLLKQLENAPKNLVLYVLGLVGAVVDDYTLVTLTIFCVLLGFVLSAVLIPITAFFGLYFVTRLVDHIAQAIVASGRTRIRAETDYMLDGDFPGTVYGEPVRNDNR
jgi:predicted PurR-regulated permease PerM